MKLDTLLVKLLLKINVVSFKTKSNCLKKNENKTKCKFNNS